jgi:hypothetical protein
MFKINLLQRVFLMLENRRECRVNDGAAMFAEAEGRGKWNWYTDKIILLLDACIAAQNSGCRAMWAKHVSALEHKRDKYREWAPK